MEQIVKSLPIDERQLAQINRHSRRELKPEEVYTFSVVLCDNEVDRDLEAFSKEALQALAKLFLGKTGIFDHDARGKNQSARIFHTEVEEVSDTITSYGAPYCRLKAQAYMVRSERLRDLILEIDAGIKKEVSIGCRVSKQRCSICGKDLSHGSCEHLPGEEYRGKLCFVVLEEPEDAYEWSFVAVPAQKNAGVVKSFFENKAAKKLSGVLTERETDELCEYLGTLEKQAQAGRQHTEALRKEVLRLSFLADFMVGNKTFAGLVKRMNLYELQELKKELKKRVKSPTGNVQLAGDGDKKEADSCDKAFVI